MSGRTQTPDRPGRGGVFSLPHVWCFTTYFAEGFPFTVFRTVSSVFFRDMKVSLEAIGLTSLYGLPWTLKFLWAPQVDEYSTRRSWMLCVQSLIAVVILAAGLAAGESGVPLVAVLFFAGAILAATHDVAIDGYYLAALDKEGQTRFLGWRVTAYRIAMMTGTGVVVTVGTTVSWKAAFLLAGGVFSLLALYHWFLLPRAEAPGKPARELATGVLRPRLLAIAAAVAVAVWGLKAALDSPQLAALKAGSPLWKQVNFPNVVSVLLLVTLTGLGLARQRLQALLTARHESFYARAFVGFMGQSRIGTVLAFIVFLRTGEFMLSSMVSPFIVDLGIKAHYGWLSSAVGLPCSIAGALAGGWLLARLGMRRLLWPFLLAQNLTNLAYMGLAWMLASHVATNTGAVQPQFIGYGNLATVAVVHGFDNFAGGLGTAVLTVYLMSICSQEFKAAHFAIGSGLMSVSGVFAGIAGGYFAAWIGYWGMFGVSFLASVPGMVLAAYVPRND
ncbi:MAG: MFS transporter [Candidatus Latescibacterota bacterium]